MSRKLIYFSSTKTLLEKLKFGTLRYVQGLRAASTKNPMSTLLTSPRLPFQSHTPVRNTKSDPRFGAYRSLLAFGSPDRGSHLRLAYHHGSQQAPYTIDTTRASKSKASEREGWQRWLAMCHHGRQLGCKGGCNIKRPAAARQPP